ncbi:hypothetical protein BCR41DRAFT_23229 [Lobosporangium transversale]|uniref:Uncharacterized protein n=1 Tax=Lobosporangium transversale TaxID=64571 RepID=A0A1Y2GSU2_9FUNG|nr:hypothetical protein BCR41DRAFT_23229 [Lobosporangium transversale]ORZ21891.1 hypothetical protein BCR41DRAFT_23229 [Lobosporangium transversale]|eukprot:XP_021883142.1 hypothetical protein BCR41DRAFT_23229 [Lobosporangium transversale]
MTGRLDEGQWDFLSGYGRAAAEALDKSIHGELCQVYSVLVPLCAVLGRAQALGVDLKDVTSLNCLDALFSSDLDPIQITRMAALDMVQGLLPSVVGRIAGGSRGIHCSRSQHQPISINANSNTNNYKQQPQQLQPQQQQRGVAASYVAMVDEDAGHSAILKLFSWVRLRGVIDVFGALLVGAITSILPENAKLTLSEFGYYALFTTSMDSLGSWTDPRVKIIAMLSNGDAGKALEAVPGAHQRFLKLLIQVFEDQLAFESNALSKKIVAEAALLAEERFDSQRGLTRSIATSALYASSPKTCASITRYALCLTDLYYLDGKHQDTLASFLYGCMVASRCFIDLDRLDRRVWSAYTHTPSIIAPPSSFSPALSQAIVPSQGGVPLSGSFGSLNETVYPTLTSLSAMNGGSVGPPIGLGLTSNSAPAPETNGMNLMSLGPEQLPGPHGAPGPMFSSLGLPGSSGSPGPALTGPSSLPPPPPPGLPIVTGGMPIAGGHHQQLPVPSAFALRAIDSCMQLQEPLASAALQQFLPRVDYNQAFAAIRLAHEHGALTFSGRGTLAMAPSNIPSMPSSTPTVGLNPGMAIPTPFGSSGSFGNNGAGGSGPGAGVGRGAGNQQGVTAALGQFFGTPTLSSASNISPRVQSSGTVFRPKLDANGTPIVKRGSVGAGGPFILNGGGSGAGKSQVVHSPHRVGGSGSSVLSPQLFLDLVFDVSFLELVSHLCKESKDQQGLLRVQARINCNRMALDVRQPFRDQVHHLAQQDLLTRLWSKYVRIG